MRGLRSRLPSRPLGVNKSSHLDASHPLLSLELFAVLQPVDARRRVSGRGAAELDGVGGRNGQELLVHPVGPRPVRSFCWGNTKRSSQGKLRLCGNF